MGSAVVVARLGNAGHESADHAVGEKLHQVVADANDFGQKG